MGVECFFDTNVLVSAASSAPEDEPKKERALELIATRDFGLSAQLLQELYVTLTRKARIPMPADEALALLAEYRTFPLVRTDYPLIVATVEISQRFEIHFRDAAIVAAAEALEATILYTEDLSDGQSYGSVVAHNPFRLRYP